MRSCERGPDAGKRAREAVQQYPIWQVVAELVTSAVTCRCARPRPVRGARRRRALTELFTELGSGRSSEAVVARACGRGERRPGHSAGTRRHRAAVALDAHARTRPSRRSSTKSSQLPAAVAEWRPPLSSRRHEPRRSIRCAPARRYVAGCGARAVVVPPLRARGADGELAGGTAPRNLPPLSSEPLAPLRDLLSDRACRRRGTTSSTIGWYCAEPGWSWPAVPRLDARELVLDPGRPLTRLSTSWRASGCPSRCGRTRSSWAGEGRSVLRRVPLVDAARYCAVDSEIVLRLHDAFCRSSRIISWFACSRPSKCPHAVLRTWNRGGSAST